MNDNIAQCPFIADVDGYSFTYSDRFLTNDDVNILPQNRYVSYGNDNVSLSFTLNEKEMESMLRFLFFTIDSGREYFLADIDVFGKVEKRKCDIISDPKVKYNGAVYKVSFEVNILE